MWLGALMLCVSHRSSVVGSNTRTTPPAVASWLHTTFQYRLNPARPTAKTFNTPNFFTRGNYPKTLLSVPLRLHRLHRLYFGFWFHAEKRCRAAFVVHFTLLRGAFVVQASYVDLGPSVELGERLFFATATCTDDSRQQLQVAHTAHSWPFVFQRYVHTPTGDR
jgi:hypothetical protein